jgi:hypothetical protein
MFYLLDLERTILNGKPYYWKENKHGYTTLIDLAGEFTGKEASQFVFNDVDNRTIMIHKNTIDKILKL